MMRLLLALTFIVALVPYGIRAAGSDVKLVRVAAAGMPMSGKCNGCDTDQKAMTPAACSASCGSFVALPLAGPILEPASVEAVRDLAEPFPVGRAIPPDPYPPTSAILS